MYFSRGLWDRGEVEAGQDCWRSGLARGSPDECCAGAEGAEAALDARAADALSARGAGPCSLAGGGVWRFVEGFAERVTWEGRLFPAVGFGDEDADRILEDEEAVYLACPAALLLALLARVARATVAAAGGAGGAERQRWEEAFVAWDNLPWTEPLAWQNLQDPLVRHALQAGVLQFKVLQGLVGRPAEICARFAAGVAQLVSSGAGISLTVAGGDAENLREYGSHAHAAGEPTRGA
ncbi:unnamed protein product [Prorocentrum cordatum]|uniref:Uncharacterized protein n=1 Tax=Prorocentrum cordatum TaxID=2364126 RepID=A0ABN9RUW0_9DINO|nr:unnamed protein product [Polarella glacialis]